MAFCLVLAGTGCGERRAEPGDAGNTDAAGGSAVIDPQAGQWFTGGRDHDQSYFSPLTGIHRGNAEKLGFAWEYDLDTTHGQEATPVVVDGVMYAAAPWGTVHALDARTGRRLWVFEPQVDPEIVNKVCCGIVNRGLSVAQGKVMIAAIDGHLYALDAATGETAWRQDTIVDRARGYTVTGSTYVAGDLVIIGNSGAELDARGYVSAYHIDSGELAWRFFTVPASREGPFEHAEMELAASTWSADTRWEVGLGGTVWDGMAYDPEAGLLYIGVGNSALYPRELRSPGGGDNLFVASIVAVEAATGRMVWYYQTVPGDQWDYTATQKMILSELDIGGVQRKVLMQAPKNGFFYVLDRISGELISAQPYVPVSWASHVDLETGRPVETGQGDYAQGPKLVFPSPAGGHNWQPMAFNPHTGLVYIPVLEASAVFWMPSEPFEYRKGGVNQGAMYAFPARNAGAWGLESEAARALPPLSQLAAGQPDTTIRGFLRAWDPVKGQTAWQVETSDRWVGEMNALWNGGGVMTTAGGLVVQGRSTGYLHVYDAKTGAELTQVNIGTSMIAAPATYELDGVQYLTIMAGYGGALGGAHPEGTAAHRYGNASRIVTLKLGGGAVPLPPEREQQAMLPEPVTARFGSESQVASGAVAFQRYCSHCHTNQASGTVPDLRRSVTLADAEAFAEVVLRGSRASRGMGSFAAVVNAEETESIRAAMLDAAWNQYDSSQQAAPTQQAPHTPPSAEPSP